METYLMLRNRDAQRIVLAGLVLSAVVGWSLSDSQAAEDSPSNNSSTRRV